MLRLLAGLISTALFAQVSETGVVSGIVVDEITGVPIAHAAIGIGLVTELRSSTFTTTRLAADIPREANRQDEIGQARSSWSGCRPDRPGSWIENQTRRASVQFDPSTGRRFGLPQVASLATSVWLEKGGHSNVTFRVARQPLFTVKGTVIDGKTGTPLEGGEIEMQPAGNIMPIDARAVQALDQGNFQFDLLTTGSYELFVRRQPGLITSAFKYPVEIGNGDIDGLRLVVPAGGRISGKVTGPRNPLLTSLSLMSAESYKSVNAQIAPDGSFFLEGLAPGKWNIGFMGRPGGEPATIAFVLQSGKRIAPILTVVEGDNPPVEIAMARSFWVIGTIFDQAGQPAAKAFVVFQDSAGLHTMESGPDGHYRTSIVGGAFLVTAWRKMPTPAMAKTCPTARPVQIKEDVSGVDVVLCQ